MQEQAAGALRNLSMHSENKNKLVSLGCIPPALIVLKSPEPRIQEQVNFSMHMQYIYIYIYIYMCVCVYVYVYVYIYSLACKSR